MGTDGYSTSRVGPTRHQTSAQRQSCRSAKQRLRSRCHHPISCRCRLAGLVPGSLHPGLGSLLKLLWISMEGFRPRPAGSASNSHSAQRPHSRCFGSGMRAIWILQQRMELEQQKNCWSSPVCRIFLTKPSTNWPFDLLMPRQSAPPRRNIICAGQFEATATGQLCRWTYQWNAQHHPICTAFQCRLRSFGPVIQQLGALLPCHFFACQHRLNPSHPGLLSFCFSMLLLEDAGGTDLLFKNAKTNITSVKHL